MIKGNMVNAFDFLIDEHKSTEKPFILNTVDKIGFTQLYNNCINLASFIQSNIGQNNKILLISSNNLFFVQCYLAILKSGNIVVPVNPSIEIKNLNFINDQCQFKLGFISSKLRFQANFEFEIFTEEWYIQNSEFVCNPLSEISNEDTIAEIIYTSGSTGVPKGVVLSHKNIISNTNSIIEYLKLTSSDIMLVVLPFYYCYGLSLLHTHLKVGGSLVFNNSFIFLGGIINDLKNYNCTGFAGVPSHYQILLRKSKSFTSTIFPNLRYVTQAGGKLSSVFIQEFINAFPQVKFFVMYGQTEATARLSYLPPDLLPEKIGSIGKGIPGVTLRVINEKGNDVVPGEIGEIIAKGDNIMNGYFMDNALTSETLKEGWLYTGDIASIDTDGFIYIESRKKEILKVGGKRISPKEIEEVILQIPDIIDCTISGVADDLLGEAMKASIIIPNDKKDEITQNSILHHCQKNLPLYKIPTYFEITSEIRLSASGKKTKN